MTAHCNELKETLEVKMADCEYQRAYQKRLVASPSTKMDDHYSNNAEQMESTLMSCELPHVNSIGVTKPPRRKGVKKIKQVLRRR